MKPVIQIWTLCFLLSLRVASQQIINDAICLDLPDPTRRLHRIAIPCAIRNISSELFQNESILSIGTFRCDASPEVCANVRSTISTAFKIIANDIVFKVPIVVDVNFVDFCTEYHYCSGRRLGFASPSRYVPMTDSDGKTRFYPQSLAKQLHTFQLPEFQPVDIKASFNSRNTFWYPKRIDDIGQPDQPNFLNIAIHEFIHGLGFASSWSEYVKNRPRGLTPLPQYQIIDGRFHFNGFYEDIFDKYLIEPASNTPLSKWIDELNKFQLTHGVEFRDEQDFGQKFGTSEEFDIARKAMQLATKRKGLAFVTKNRNIVFLESSLLPYVPGASISHLDFDTYTGTSDFLMRHRVDDAPAASHSINTTGDIRLIGPGVLSILETLGYTINNNPRSARELQS